MNLSDLRVDIYADGADLEGIRKLNDNPLIKGMTTNPTLMKKVGIQDYETFARQALEFVTEKPISFEVFSDDFVEMHRQARKIHLWGPNVYVKIPITNTQGRSSLPLVTALGCEGVRVNVTAMLTLEQVIAVNEALQAPTPAIVSVFAGRIADTGVDPIPLMWAAGQILAGKPQAQLLWASVREVLNIFQADQCGCKIVTVPHDILGKALKMVGLDLAELSLDTVKMFASDAKSAGYTL